MKAEEESQKLWELEPSIFRKPDSEVNK